MLQSMGSSYESLTSIFLSNILKIKASYVNTSRILVDENVGFITVRIFFHFNLDASNKFFDESSDGVKLCFY